MNAQVAYESGKFADYEDRLNADERFARFVEELSAIPAFVEEALASLHVGRATYLDSLVNLIAESGDVERLIDSALEAFAEAQLNKLPNALKDESQIVAEWQAFQRQKESLK